MTSPLLVSRKIAWLWSHFSMLVLLMCRLLLLIHTNRWTIEFSTNEVQQKKISWKWLSLVQWQLQNKNEKSHAFCLNGHILTLLHLPISFLDIWMTDQAMFLSCYTSWCYDVCRYFQFNLGFFGLYIYFRWLNWLMEGTVFDTIYQLQSWKSQ